MSNEEADAERSKTSEAKVPDIVVEKAVKDEDKADGDQWKDQRRRRNAPVLAEEQR